MMGGGGGGNGILPGGNGFLPGGNGNIGGGNHGGSEISGGGEGGQQGYGRRKRGENRARGLNRRSRVQARSPIYGEDEYTSQVPPPAVEADGNLQSPTQDSSHRFEAPAGNGEINATGGLHPRPAVGGPESSEADAVSDGPDGEAPPLPNRNTGGGAGPGPYELGSKRHLQYPFGRQF